MEDFDEVNAKIEEFIKLKGEWNEYLNGKKGDYDIREDVAYQFYKNGEDFILYERVWKKEARYLIKKGDRSGFTELISIISLYNISTPKVEEKFNMSYAKKYESDSYYWREHRGDYEILESGRKYKKEVDTFNDVVDDIVNQAILMKNKELAECALELYRKGVTLTDNSIWKYNDDALNAAKKRIQEAK